MADFVEFSKWFFLLYGLYLLCCGQYRGDKRDGLLLIVLSLILFVLKIVGG